MADVISYRNPDVATTTARSMRQLWYLVFATTMLVAILALYGCGDAGPSITGSWIKESGNAIICCGDSVAVLPLGKTLEFRGDGNVNINSSTYKYRWQDQSHLVIDYPMDSTVYEANLSADGKTLDLGEQFAASSHLTYKLIRQK